MLNEEKLFPIEKKIYQKLKEVVDPEFSFPIVERGLINEIKVKRSKAKIIYRLTVPFCPPVFVLYIGREIKKKALTVPGVEEVEVRVQKHVQEDIINR